MTAMDFRQYDNAIGRFVCQDPITHYSQSPYQFGNGNPVYWADPSGLDGVGGWTSSSSFGSTFETPNSTGYNTGYNIGSAFGTFSENVGSAWGDGGILPVSMSGNNIIINWNAIGDSYKYNFTTGKSYTWREGFITRNGNGTNILDEVTPGRWVSNEGLAKRIAKEYGYDDWKEIRTFLDENPFTRTHEGVSFIGYEAISSKYGGSTFSRLVDSGAKKGTSMVFGQALKKIIGKGAGQLLSSTEINEPDHPNARLQRFEECKQRLIDHVFTKPLEYQTPSMYNNMQSWKSHSSIYDRIMHRYY